MGTLSRSVKCSTCEVENSIHINSGLELREITISGKCQNCNAAIQLNFNVIEKEVVKSELPSETVQTESTPTVNVDDALGIDIPSNTLRDIMDD